MSISEMIEKIEYVRDRLQDERGSDFSGVQALDQLLTLLTKDELWFVILDNIYEACLTKHCKDCILTDDGYCILGEGPPFWSTDKIKEKLKEVEK